MARALATLALLGAAAVAASQVAAVPHAGAAVAMATAPAIWVQSGYDDFRAGEVASVSLDSEGDIRLAPALELLGDTREAFVWAVEEAADGSVYAAAGTEGRIYRLPPGAGDAEPERFFEAGGTVHAMAMGPDGDLYLAASPGGDLWRLPLAGGEMPTEPWLSLEARYVWSLAFAPDGTLYAGTGEDGRIWRVDTAGAGGAGGAAGAAGAVGAVGVGGAAGPAGAAGAASATGAAELLYDTDESHITALAVAADGSVLAGSADNGHLYRIGPQGNDVFVLFDASLRQITGIVPTAEGIWVAAMEQATTDAPAASPEAPPRAAGGPAGGASGASGASGAVFLVHDDGLVESIWESPSEEAYSLAAAAPGAFVGTGPEGRLLRVGPGRTTTILPRVAAAQITAATVGGGNLLLGSSNLGRVYRLGSGYRADGEYLSQVKDTATTSRWGRVRWRGDSPEGTSIRLFTRTGNTADPDDTWSDWSGPYADAAGTPIDSPPARFIQWKAQLASRQPESSPALRWVELVYVQRNLRPVVTALTIHPGGVVYRQNPAFEDSLPIGALPPSIERELARQQGRDAPAAPSTASFLGRAYFLPGSRTITWEAADPNGDRMSYALLQRGEGETEWKPIASAIQETLHVWDTRTVPDGLYRVRLVAGDGPSNPLGQQLDGERSSAAFVIDNTAPEVGDLAAVAEAGGLRITGTATDATSLIQTLEYAVDGATWRAILPADGLADAGREQIDFTVTLPPGEHTIVVRVTDDAFNAGTAKIVVTAR
jgi:hypothetical protein